MAGQSAFRNLLKHFFFGAGFLFADKKQPEIGTLLQKKAVGIKEFEHRRKRSVMQDPETDEKKILSAYPQCLPCLAAGGFRKRNRQNIGTERDLNRWTF